MNFNFKQFYFKESDIHGRIKMLIYGQSFIFFFLYKNNVYGGSEEARLTYAAMKSKDDGVEDMTFGATNLSESMKGTPVEEFFTVKDINHISIIQNKEAEEFLVKKTGHKDKDFVSTMNQLHLNRKSREKDSDFGLHKINMDVE